MYVYRSLYETGHFILFQVKSWTGADTASSFLIVSFLYFFFSFILFPSGERLDRHGHCIIVIAEGAGVSFTYVSALYWVSLYVSAVHCMCLIRVCLIWIMVIAEVPYVSAFRV